MRMACAIVLMVFCAPLAIGQHLGEREQWIPQAEDDARLWQPVQMEIIGRATRTGLPLLVEKTGVSLSVAPESLDTVGERKFTIIAQGCSLKAIMVHLCEALQECHWDVDTTGKEPVYLLHRNAGMAYTEMRVHEWWMPVRPEQMPSKREARLEAARSALSLSPEQLADLKKADLYLAAAVLDPGTREAMEALLSLPPEDLAAFADSGSISMEYSSAPESVKQSARWALELKIQALEAEETNNPEGRARTIARLHSLLADMSGTVLIYEGGYQVRLAVWPTDAPEAEVSQLIIPPLHSRMPFTENWQRRLVLGTSAEDKADAEKRRALETWRQTDLRIAREERDAVRRARWPEHSAPALQPILELPRRESISLSDLQQRAARATGLSVISDCFTTDEIHIRGGDLDAPEIQVDPELLNQPTWRLLNMLGERSPGSRAFEWRPLGNVLVFHHVQWPRLSLRELPESWLQLYSTKVASRGTPAMDDLVELATMLSSRPTPPGDFSIPSGVDPMARQAASSPGLWFLTFYGSLSAEQEELARSPEGLPYDRMSIRQRALLLEAVGPDSRLAHERAGPFTGMTPEEVGRARFRVRVSSTNGGDRVELRLEMAGAAERAVFHLESGDR